MSSPAFVSNSKYMEKENKKNYWDDLSIKDKHQLIKIFVDNGITDAKAMATKYNEFQALKDGEYDDIEKSEEPIGSFKWVEDNYGLKMPYKSINYLNSNSYNSAANGVEYLGNISASNRADLNQYIANNSNYYVSESGDLFHITDDSGFDMNKVHLLEKTDFPKFDYIGGSTLDARLKFIDRIPGFRNKISEIANIYEIDKNLLMNRIVKEGFIDHQIEQYNDYSTLEDQKNYFNDFYSQGVNGFEDLGLDDSGSLLEQGKLNVKGNINYYTTDAVNEHNREVKSTYFDNVNDALHVLAANIKYYQDIVKKRYSDAENHLNAYTNAAFNLGPYHKDLKDTTLIRNNYAVPSFYKNGGHLFDEGGGITNTEIVDYFSQLDEESKNTIVLKYASRGVKDLGVVIDDYNSHKNGKKSWLDAYEEGKVQYPEGVLDLNTTSTAYASSYKERRMDEEMKKRGYYNNSSSKYDIPFIKDKSIKVRGNWTSENVLDSLAKYAGPKYANLPIKQALGIAAQETGMGSYPLYNLIKISSDRTDKEKEALQYVNKSIMNSNFFKHKGFIPAASLVRDFAFYDNNVKNTPPLQHAFEYFKQGKYNPGDPNHTSDVNKAGEEVIKEQAVKNWWERSGQYWYTTGQGPKKAKGGYVIKNPYVNELKNGGDTKYVKIDFKEDKKKTEQQVEEIKDKYATFFNEEIPKDLNLIDKLRYRIYNNIDPTEYDNISEKIKNTILNNGKHRHYNSYDDLWATYLQIPDQYRLNIPQEYKLYPAEYLPTKRIENDIDTYRLHLNDEELKNIVNEGLSLNYGENNLSKVLFARNLGEHTIGRGYDNKGDYISYYDRWDLNPFKGLFKVSTEDGKKLKKIVNLFNKENAGDISFGIGKPFDIYDRIYLDDYYNIPDEYREGYWLQPAVITAEKAANKFLWGGEYKIK